MMMRVLLALMVFVGMAGSAFACAEHEAAALHGEKVAAVVMEGAKVAPENKEQLPALPDFASFVPSDSCNGIDYYDFGSALDGAAYYVAQDTGAVIGACGGICRSGCENCPPKAWTCGDTDITPAVKRNQE